jgi:hypothetical protein
VIQLARCSIVAATATKARSVIAIPPLPPPPIRPKNVPPGRIGAPVIESNEESFGAESRMRAGRGRNRLSITFAAKRPAEPELQTVCPHDSELVISILIPPVFTAERKKTSVLPGAFVPPATVEDGPDGPAGVATTVWVSSGETAVTVVVAPAVWVALESDEEWSPPPPELAPPALSACVSGTVLTGGPLAGGD